MAKNTAITFKGLDETIRDLKALPAQATRAARNALGVVLTESQREIIDITNRELGLKKSEIRRRLKVERPKFVSGQVILSGQITATNARIRLSQYKTRIVKKSATRAAVYVKDEIGKGERLSESAFINPRFNRKTPYRRITRGGRRVPRTPIVQASGPSMAVHLRAIVTPAYQQKKGDRFVALFNQKLDEQIVKGRR